MKAIRFVFCLFAALMLTTLNGLEVSHRPLEG